MSIGPPGYDMGPLPNFVAMPFTPSSLKTTSSVAPIYLAWYMEQVPQGQTLAIPELYSYLLGQRLLSSMAAARD